MPRGVFSEHTGNGLRVELERDGPAERSEDEIWQISTVKRLKEEIGMIERVKK